MASQRLVDQAIQFVVPVILFHGFLLSARSVVV
jgi:hypothetical protein